MQVNKLESIDWYENQIQMMFLILSSLIETHL